MYLLEYYLTCYPENVSKHEQNTTIVVWLDRSEVVQQIDLKLNEKTALIGQTKQKMSL